MVPGLEPYKIVSTGKKFRVAEGTLIPNKGELRLEGMSNNTPVDIKAQVAGVTKPLASIIEMADAGNIVITHRLGGPVKHLSPEALERVMEAIKREQGAEIPLSRQGSTYILEVDVPTANTEGKGKQMAKPMEVDYVDTRNIFAAFWEKDEEDFGCSPCMPFQRLA